MDLLASAYNTVPEGVSVNMRGPEKFVPYMVSDKSGV